MKLKDLLFSLSLASVGCDSNDLDGTKTDIDLEEQADHFTPDSVSEPVPVDLYLSRAEILKACDIVDMDCWEDEICLSTVEVSDDLLASWQDEALQRFYYEFSAPVYESTEIRLCAGGRMTFLSEQSHNFYDEDGFGCQVTQYFDGVESGDVNGYRIDFFSPESEQTLWYCENESSSHGSGVAIVRIAALEAVGTMLTHCNEHGELTEDGCDLSLGVE